MRAHTVAIAGGKGGVGKTSIAVNLAIALARLNHRVCLLDDAQEPGQACHLLGLTARQTLSHYLRGESGLQDVLLKGPSDISALPGAAAISHYPDMNELEQTRLLEGLKIIEKRHDWLIIDTAAGTGIITTRMIHASQRFAVVITPEPTSLTDAFALLKSLRRNNYRRQVLVIVNLIFRGDRPKSIYRRFQAAVRKYIGLETHYLGAIWMDESLRLAATRQTPVATLPADDPSCRLFMRLADSLLSSFESDVSPTGSLGDHWRGQAHPAEPRPSAEILPLPIRPLASQKTSNTRRPNDLWLNASKENVTAPEIYELLATLLKQPSAQELSIEQLTKLEQQLKNLLEKAENRKDGTSPAIKKVISQLRALHPPKPGHYDSARFGSQYQLINSIKQLRESASLTDMLAGITGQAKP